MLDLKTRWNSMHDMFERALRVRKVINLTMVLHPEIFVGTPLMTDTQWSNIAEIVTFLKPFKDATNMTCGDKVFYLPSP
jgi:hypothetical protein